MLLRPWRLTDAPAVVAACQDPLIQLWTVVPTPYTHADAVAFIAEFAKAAWEVGGVVLAVTEANSGSVAGSIGCDVVTDGVGEVGYWTAPEFRGLGLTSDALRTLSTWLLGEGGANRLEVLVDARNQASVRVARAAGFIIEPSSDRDGLICYVRT